MPVVILSGLWSLVVSTFNDCRRAFDTEQTTKFLLCLNVFLYFFPLAPVAKACLSLDKVCTKNGWHRLLLSPLHHFKPRHLVFNMLCLFYVGFLLERRMGTPWFLFLVCVFTVLSGPIYLLLQVLGALLLYPQGCVVGFSGVLFGLIVVKNDYNPDGVTNLWGITVSNRYAVWAELVLAQVLNQKASFTCHLAGILVGLMYTRGPLETIMKKCAGLMFSIGLRIHNLYDFITGTRHWSEEEVRLDELRGNRLRRLDEAAD